MVGVRLMAHRRQYSPADVIALVVAAADRNGLDRVEFLGGIIAEGLNVYAERPARQEDWSRYWEPPEPLFDVSFGLGQKNVRYSEPYRQWCERQGIDFYGPEADAYPGDEAIAEARERFFDPQYALDVAAAGYRHWRYDPEVDPLHAWVAYNGPIYYRKRDWRTSPNLGNYRDGLAQAARILEDTVPAPNRLKVTDDDVRLRERPDTNSPILYQARAGDVFTPSTDHAWRHGTVGGRTGWMAAEYLAPEEFSPPGENSQALAFDPNTPTELQVQDFSCSIRSITWVLKSLGVDIDAGTLEDEMVPSIVTRKDGLLDSRGYGLADVLKRHLDPQWHNRIRVYESLTWADMQLRATGGPMALGGRGWYHWTAVRGLNPDGSLKLANPAPGWKGVQQTLTRADWDRLGPWSGVLVDATPTA